MLLVVVDQTRTGRISPHLSKILPCKLNNKTCSTLTWAITAWPTITLRHRGIVIILPVPMPELFRMSLPKLKPPRQRPCVLTSFFGVHILTIPPPKAIDVFNDEVQQAATGPAPAFDELPDQGPVPNRRATEVLRQLALLYLNDPNSQLAMIRMEPGYADEVMVVIALKLTDL
jgi:hypothetical protein